MKLRLATVFSGIGAVEWALKRINIEFDIAFACDIDKFVKQSYISNYNSSSCNCENKIDIPDSKVCEDHLEFDWYDDIHHIDGRKFGDIDLFVGGSPCQSFSIAGDMEGLDDDRGSLIMQYIRLVDEIRPEVFIYENVAGIKSAGNGEAFDHLLAKFEEMGYKVHHEVLNARDYGIPQSRNRLFIIGFKNPKFFSFPTPIGTPNFTILDILEDSTTHKDIRDYSTDWDLRARYNLKYWEPVKELKTKHIEKRYFLSDTVTEYVLAGGSKNYYVEPVTNPTIAFALLTTMHKMHRAGIDNYITYDKEGNRLEKLDFTGNDMNKHMIRKLTPRECLRLMGFDDEFEIVVSNTQMYRQCGNSIVVDVIIHLLESILPAIDDSYASEIEEINKEFRRKLPSPEVIPQLVQN